MKHKVTECALFFCFGHGITHKGCRIRLILGFRNKIGFSRQHFPDGAYHAGDMFDAVDDHTFFVTEDDIAVFSHNFDNQFFSAQIPQLI